jgi:hypothetical protein
MMKLFKRKGGFTAVELIISVTLATVFLLIIVETALLLAKSHERSRTYLDMNSTAFGAFSRFSRDIRRATSVDTVNSTLGASDGKLVLRMRKDDGTYDSTTFYLSENRVRELFNGDLIGDLTQADIVVSNLTFRLFQVSTTTAVRVEMTIVPEAASTTIPALNFYGTYVLRGSYAQ